MCPGKHTHSGSSPNYRLFTGEQRDSETAFYYLRARYYDPSTGRFLTRDPFGGFAADPQSLNLYVYALNNPILLVDPYGLFGLGDLKKVGGAIGGGIKSGGEWLGEDYHWATAGAVAGGVAVGAGIIILTGGTATPLVVQVGAGVLISVGLPTSATLTAVSLKGAADKCRSGSKTACVQFWTNTILSGTAGMPPVSRFMQVVGLLRLGINYGPEGLDWLSELMEAGNEPMGKE